MMRPSPTCRVHLRVAVPARDLARRRLLLLDPVSAARHPSVSSCTLSSPTAPPSVQMIRQSKIIRQRENALRTG